MDQQIWDEYYGGKKPQMSNQAEEPVPVYPIITEAYISLVGDHPDAAVAAVLRRSDRQIFMEVSGMAPFELLKATLLQFSPDMTLNDLMMLEDQCLVHEKIAYRLSDEFQNPLWKETLQELSAYLQHLDQSTTPLTPAH